MIRCQNAVLGRLQHILHIRVDIKNDRTQSLVLSGQFLHYWAAYICGDMLIQQWLHLLVEYIFQLQYGCKYVLVDTRQ